MTVEIKSCKGLFYNSCIDSFVSVTGHANFHFPAHCYEKQADNNQCTRPRIFFHHLYLPLCHSSSKPVNGGQRYRSIQCMPIQKLRNSALATYTIHIHGNALHEGWTRHGSSPFGRSKVSVFYVLVYNRVDRVCRAIRPAVPLVAACD